MPRLLFEKTGNAVWISHLDLMRLFQRAFKRAGLPLTHSGGFTPRPQVSIALPLSVPSLAALSIREFITVYNRYFWPLLVTNSQSMRTVQLAVAAMKDAEFNSTALDMACAACCIIPVVLVFVIGHKYIVKGMTAGAVKG